MMRVLGSLPPYLTVTGVVLSFLIPFALYKIFGLLHKYGNPPWKNEKNSK